MGYACCTTEMAPRGFLTRAEKIEMLREYEEALAKELEGVRERIADLEKK